MHLRIDIDPQQSARAERKSTGSVRQRSAVDLCHVADGSHDGGAGAVESRGPTQRPLQKELRRYRLHQARLQRQHPRVKIASGEHSAGETHYTNGDQVTSSG